MSSTSKLSLQVEHREVKGMEKISDNTVIGGGSLQLFVMTSLLFLTRPYFEEGEINLWDMSLPIEDPFADPDEPYLGLISANVSMAWSSGYPQGQRCAYYLFSTFRRITSCELRPLSAGSRVSNISNIAIVRLSETTSSTQPPSYRSRQSDFDWTTPVMAPPPEYAP